MDERHTPLPNGVRLSCGAKPERSQTKDYNRNRGAGSFRRLLGSPLTESFQAGATRRRSGSELSIRLPHGFGPLGENQLLSNLWPTERAGTVARTYASVASRSRV